MRNPGEENSLPVEIREIGIWGAVARSPLPHHRIVQIRGLWNPFIAAALPLHPF
jgi:hypothetical protein